MGRSFQLVYPFNQRSGLRRSSADRELAILILSRAFRMEPNFPGNPARKKKNNDKQYDCRNLIDLPVDNCSFLTAKLVGENELVGRTAGQVAFQVIGH